MSYKALLVHADTSAASEARTAAALDLAGKFGATVIGLAAGLVRPVVDPYSGAVAGIALQSEQEQLEADLKAAEAKFKALAALAAIPHEFSQSLDFPSQAMIAKAAAADLLIVGPAKTGLGYDAYADVGPGDLLMASGRPVLVVPTGTKTVAASHVLIAWKGTREARRVSSDVLPFLKGATKVFVVAITDDEDVDDELADVAAFLKRHNVTAKLQRVAPQGAAEDQLMGIAKAERVDLIAAGGYGHARLREWMFGGVTRALLTSCAVPVFISH